MMTEDKKRILTVLEESFKERCISLRIKFRSKAFYNEQAAYFVGAMNTLMTLGIINEPIAHWSLYIMSGREIVEYKLI
jgi:hypothetical protein